MNDVHGKVRKQLLKLLRVMAARSRMAKKKRRAFDYVIAALLDHDLPCVTPPRPPVETWVLREALATAACDAKVFAELDAIEVFQRVTNTEMILVDKRKIDISLTNKRMVTLGRCLTAMATGKSHACSYSIKANDYVAEFSVVDHYDTKAKKEADEVDVPKGLLSALWHLVEALSDINLTFNKTCSPVLQLMRSTGPLTPNYAEMLESARAAARGAIMYEGLPRRLGQMILSVVDALVAFNPPLPPKN